MKKTYKYTLSSLLMAGSLVACSPDDFEGVSENGIPEANALQSSVKIEVDQELNQVCLSLNAPEVYPIWTITLPNGKEEKSAVNGFTKIYTNAGDYTVTMKVGNHNGISDGTYTTTFHINNSIVDFGKYTTMLSKANWHIANKEKGHLACGEPGSDGTNWWSGDPDCKLNEGVYDNELTFTSDFQYTFNPGDHGTIYVNKDVTIWPDYRNPDEDFNVPVELQNAEYGLEVDGDDLYLTFKKGTYFPYIANDDIWNTPKYRVVNLTTKKMTLLIDNGNIAWQYILTTENTVEKAFTGFTYDQPDNIWKNVEVNAGEIYYADGGWSPYPDNGGATFNVTNQETNVVLPLATASQWQAQFPILTNVGPGSQYMTSAKHYDFSCVITSNKDLKGMTLKLVESGENSVPGSLGIAYDANAVFYDNSTNLTAYEDYVFYLVDQPGVDIQDNVLQLVLDFGGCEEGTEVTVKNIVLIDHALNKELDKLPKDEPDVPTGGVIWAGVNDPANLMTKGELSLASTWCADDNWGVLNDQPNVDINGRNALITMLAANGGSQWQGQVHLNTKVAIEEGKAYDFSITFNASQDLAGATVKPHPDGDDGHFFSEGRHDITGYENVIVTYENFLSDFSTENLVITLDFPGCAAGTTIEVKDIIIQEHNEYTGGGSGSDWVDVNSADNLMTSGSLELASTWCADDNWGVLGDQPNVDINGRNALITMLAANGGSQWQGQVHFNTFVAIEEGKTYDFAIVLNPSQDIFGATVKPHPDGDDGHFFSEGRHDLTAYEDNRVTYTEFTADFNTENLVITLDFPGCAAGTTIEVKDIIIQEHIAGGNGGSSAAFDYDSSDNLWKTATVSNAGIYYAPNWSQIADFNNEITNQKITVSLYEATFGEWQAQLPVLTDLDKSIISAEKKYDFQCKITSSKDHPGMTLKLVEEGPNSTPGSLGINYDSNAIFYQPGVALPAYEEVTVTLTGMQGVALQDNPLKLVLDFGNNAADTDIEICDIILREAK